MYFFWLYWVFMAFLELQQQRLLSNCGARASDGSGFSCPRAWPLQHEGFSACRSWGLEHRLSCSAEHGIFPIRDRTWVSCIGRQILHHWGTREAAYSTPSQSAQTAQKPSPVLPSPGPLLRVPLPDHPPPTPATSFLCHRLSPVAPIMLWDRRDGSSPGPTSCHQRLLVLETSPVWSSSQTRICCFFFIPKAPSPSVLLGINEIIHPTHFIEPLLYASPFVESKLSFYFPKEILVCFRVKHPVQCLPCSWWSTDGKHIAILEKHPNRYKCA